ncbi:MAG: DUF5518 domain-containing protein [Halorubrum sp.]|uniref:DUF5518 domain-containing protein n=1 Tax=Halorubrum sp. TaxID=1879286 RepID=UPI003970CBA8
MVPDDSSSSGDTRIDDAGDTRIDDAGDARNRRDTDDGAAADPNADSDGFLAPGDDSPADLFDVLVYGLVGGVVGSVLSFVPFATVLGGAVAGYLCGGTSADGLKTGTVAGAVMTLPFLAFVVFLLFFLGVAGAPAEFGLFALFVVGLGAVYTLGSGVIGGYLGHYLRGEL